MKTIGIFIIILLLSSQLRGQENNQLESMIKVSLNSYVGKLKESSNSTYPYFSIDNYPPHFKFEDTIQGIPINYINLQNRSACEKELKKGVGVISLTRLQLEKTSLKITFAMYNAKIEGKNHLHMAVVESTTFVYIYSCEKESWILQETKYGGV
ncbi:hypothetical protein [Bacteroides reticulotermitis]|uniref:DUF4348 domain-containing protein n=1 Tax=Bacteroides reticulotermitis TaxID=1133319 RepID=A0A840D4K3_9BACE|nr:hypothetical protein [Bacteroides reticulotermitis]MBB4045368.1 hypothetical protein [Bacteroides reticulotermitis]